MDINSLDIKNKTNYNLDNICCIDDFDSNSFKITKKESCIDANIYYNRCALNLNDTIILLYFIINNLIGYIEEIDRSRDKYLVELVARVIKIYPVFLIRYGHLLKIKLILTLK